MGCDDGREIGCDEGCLVGIEDGRLVGFDDDGTFVGFALLGVTVDGTDMYIR